MQMHKISGAFSLALCGAILSGCAAGNLGGSGLPPAALRPADSVGGGLPSGKIYDQDSVGGGLPRVQGGRHMDSVGGGLPHVRGGRHMDSVGGGLPRVKHEHDD